MTATITIRSNGKRHLARVVTETGDLIGQAIHDDAEVAARRAIRQARNWSADRGWAELTIKREARP
jgi:hypothetical protein